LFAACAVITGDLGRTIAIEIDGEPVRNVEEDDTITLTARAIDAAGDTVSDAMIVWEQLAADSGDPDIGFDIDSTTGVVRALSPSSGRVRARVEELRSDTITIWVTGAPDSIRSAGDTLVTMASDAAVSPRLMIALIDLTTDSAVVRPLADKAVTFTLVDPLPASLDAQGFFLTVSDSVPGPDPHSVTVTTDGENQAYVVVRRLAGSSLTDSAVVHAVAVTAIGDTVEGSPVSFILVFESGP
jgi:hypothetical protein